ncbi:MAG TPA: hypothetical protein VK879_00575 [Candidatus Sulfomarinibacteraceae bacterium]|nr:hypothetical protein [Candidatus Sulfomarinibacteraceae bacterium]
MAENDVANGCYTCELVARRDAGVVEAWDCILRTAHWDLVHSYNTSLPGWLVLVSRRHMAAVAEMHEAEALELGSLLRRASLGLQAVTGCAKTYVMQFAEDPQHPHVHFHVVPRMPGQPEAYRSTGIFHYLGVPPEERVREEEMNELAARLGEALGRI